MCRRIKKLQATVDELTNIVKTHELERLRDESKELKEIQALLKNIRLNVKKIKVVPDSNIGANVVQISYDVPTVTLYLDDNLEPYKNETFYAINALNLISFEDMEKIKKVLNDKDLLDK